MTELGEMLINEGIEKGLEKGRKEGIEKGKIEVVKKSIQKGLDNETIADITGLTIEKNRINKRSNKLIKYKFMH